MRHIERIVWKPINWWPESPEQYPDGLPIAKPESLLVEISEGRWLEVRGLALGDTVEVMLIEGQRTELHTWPGGQVTRGAPTGVWHEFEPETMSAEEVADWMAADRGFPDGPRVSRVLAIPADRVQDVVNALIYVHRRTHEHEYTGPDAGLETEGGENDA
jgi:hypothetical protein